MDDKESLSLVIVCCGLYVLKCLLYGGGGGFVVKSCSTLVIPCTVACQAPLSQGFSRQEYWRGLPFLLQAFIV